LTEGSLLTIVLGKGKCDLFWENEMGFGAYTDSLWQTPSWEGKERERKT